MSTRGDVERSTARGSSELGERRLHPDAGTHPHAEPTGVDGLGSDRAGPEHASQALQRAVALNRDRFENSPIPMTDEDWSEVKTIVDGLRASGVCDITQHVRDHPESLAQIGPAAKILDANPAAVKVYKAASKQELLRAFNAPPDLDTYNPTTGLSDIYVTLIARFASGETRVELEGPDTALDGSSIFIRTTTSIAPGHENDWASVLQTVEDFTSRKQAEDALLETKERYELALRGANDGIWDWNFHTGEIFYSSQMAEIAGLSSGDGTFDSEAFMALVHRDDVRQFDAALQAHLDGKAELFSSEFRLADPRGAETWVLSRGVALRKADGKAYRMAGSLTDITDRIRAQEEIRRLAMTDPLTGLANRNQFHTKLDDAIKYARRHNELVALLLLDLDDFKSINDTYGHSVGDALLKTVAEKLLEVSRQTDAVARLGGDEFAIVLYSPDDVEASATPAHRIVKSLSAPHEILGHTLHIGASIGIALFPNDATDTEDLQQRADIALYEAKNAGRGTFRFFDGKMIAHHKLPLPRGRGLG